MVKMQSETVDAVNKLEGKGNVVLLTGPTGCGKSTSLGSFTESEAVQAVLQVREADGKGSTAKANIIVTNHPDIPAEGVIIRARKAKLDMKDVNDDGDLIGEFLYVAAANYKKNPQENLFKEKIRITFRNRLGNAANDSLAYKLRYIDEQDCEELIQYISTVSISDVMAVYEEMVARTAKKSQAAQKEFVEVLKSNENLKDYVDGYWERILKYINNDGQKLIQTLKENGAEIREEEDESVLFDVFFGAEDIESELLSVLLKSEDSSKEYFLSDLSIIFRGADSFFEGKNAQQLKVAEENGESIYCLHLVDTQGLFHSTGVKPREEFERIVDMLTEFHSNSLVIVINSEVDNTVKDSYEAIRLLLSEATRNIDIYLLYTYWDGYMKRLSQKDVPNASRFGFGSASNQKIDWNKTYEKAQTEQEELTRSFREAIASNSSKNKPNIKGAYCAALLTDPSSEMENLLFSKEVFYPIAMKSLVEKMLETEAINGPKYRVCSADDWCVMNIEGSNQSVRELYRNMVVDCKGLRLYASTVRACVNKWVYSGTEHRSDVAENSYGFKNIRTAFVQNMRNLGDPIIRNIDIQSGNVLEIERRDEFVEELRRYLKNNLGREITKAVGDEAYNKGFTGAYGLYQYEYFNNMITYTQNHFFRGEQLVFGDSTQELNGRIEAALNKCVRNFIDQRCIEVY